MRIGLRIELEGGGERNLAGPAVLPDLALLVPCVGKVRGDPPAGVGGAELELVGLERDPTVVGDVIDPHRQPVDIADRAAIVSPVAPGRVLEAADQRMHDAEPVAAWAEVGEIEEVPAFPRRLIPGTGLGRDRAGQGRVEGGGRAG